MWFGTTNQIQRRRSFLRILLFFLVFSVSYRTYTPNKSNTIRTYNCSSYNLIKKVIDGCRIEIDCVHLRWMLNGLPSPSDVQKYMPKFNDNLFGKIHAAKFHEPPMVLDVMMENAVFCQTNHLWQHSSDLESIRKYQGDRIDDFQVFKMFTCHSFNMKLMPHPRSVDNTQSAVLLLQNAALDSKFIFEREASNGTVTAISTQCHFRKLDVSMTKQQYFDLNYFIASLLYVQAPANKARDEDTENTFNSRFTVGTLCIHIMSDNPAAIASSSAVITEFELTDMADLPLPALFNKVNETILEESKLDPLEEEEEEQENKENHVMNVMSGNESSWVGDDENRPFLNEPITSTKQEINTYCCHCDCLQWLTNLWAELLALTVVVLSFVHSTHLGVVILALEVGFNVTLICAILTRVMWSETLLPVSLYALNRICGLGIPLYGLIHVAVCWEESTKTGIDITLLVLYALDLLVTLITFGRIARWFVPMQVRLATNDDLDSLLKIEESAFERAEHRASRSVIERRLQNPYWTTFVCEHVKHGVVKSLYLKSIDAKQIEHEESVSWYAVANDFPLQAQVNAQYIVGLQGLKDYSFGANLLYMHTMKYVVRMDHTIIFGGLRLPGFASSDIHDLDEYIASGQDKLLSRVLRDSNPLFPITVLKGVHNYWDDPESRSCAAILKSENTFYGASWFVRRLFVPWLVQNVAVLSIFLRNS